jgi:hypothetical protein
MERVAHFFSADFFCRKAINYLMQENTDSPQMLGFRKCMRVVYQGYKSEQEKKNKKSAPVAASFMVREHLLIAGDTKSRD